jgi:hypothetical protein
MREREPYHTVDEVVEMIRALYKAKDVFGPIELMFQNSKVVYIRDGRGYPPGKHLPVNLT